MKTYSYQLSLFGFFMAFQFGKLQKEQPALEPSTNEDCQIDKGQFVPTCSDVLTKDAVFDEPIGEPDPGPETKDPDAEKTPEFHVLLKLQNKDLPHELNAISQLVEDNVPVNRIAKALTFLGYKETQIKAMIEVAVFGSDLLRNLYGSKKISHTKALEIARIEDPVKQDAMIRQLGLSDKLKGKQSKNLSKRKPATSNEHPWWIQNTALAQFDFKDIHGKGASSALFIASAELDRFVQLWQDHFGQQPVYARELVKMIEKHGCFNDHIKPIKKPMSRSIWVAKNVLSTFSGSNNARNGFWWLRGNGSNKNIWMLVKQ